ncbi:serine hydrolase [Nocardioides zeae]|uniref:Serine hydrolase n=1 Tax=Nocardioides zeae TaxID=1457234 RepID=A0A6P0HK10_9ACTN|nr:serine hydrolase [Nocardioides zeae]
MRVRRLRTRLHEAGLSGSFLVRDLRTGQQVAIGPEERYAVASLVKVPLAMAVLERVATGVIDPARRLRVGPGDPALADRPGPPGTGRFRHAVDVAVEDLLYLAVSLSDSTAADALFGLVPPPEVGAHLAAIGIEGIEVRHPVGDLNATPAERLDAAEGHLAHRLAIGTGTADGGHAVAQLDLTRASTATATALADLLEVLWAPAGASRVRPEVALRVRTLLGLNVMRQRLATELASDAARWSSKTGTLLNERHEAGVVEHDDGGVLAVVALTRSRVPAVVQPVAEAEMAAVARGLHDVLRAG